MLMSTPATNSSRAVCALALVACAAIALPAMSAPDNEGGRYEMSEVENGFVRLDKETGAMSLCTRNDESWACRPMVEKNGPAGDVAKLRQENAELKQELKRMEETFGLDAPGGQSRGDDEVAREGGPGNSPEIHLPDEQQVDEAIDYLEGMIRKFRERFERFGEKTKPRSTPDDSEDQTTPL